MSRWDTRYRSATKVGQWFGSAYADPIYGAFDSIATTTVGAGGQVTVTFSSIPSTYKHLQVRGFVKANAGYELRTQVNSDTGSNYSRHVMMGDGATTASNGNASSTYFRQFVYTGLPTAANTFGIFILDILDYTDTNKYKTLRGLYGQDSNGSGEVGIASAAWLNTSAITSVSISTAGTIQQYSNFTLYGING